jgi:lysozyme
VRASPRCIAAIKQFEGFRRASYLDAAGVWTIGYGDTRNAGPGVVCTEEQAGAWLAAALSDVEAALNNETLVSAPLTQGQFDALADFAYNLGVGSLMRSTLLRLVNAGDIAGAAAEFPKWANSRGRVLPGLMKRRLAEQSWFSEPEPSQQVS